MVVGRLIPMGRRSVHSPEELRQLILSSARTIIEKNGLPGLSAREIAKLIGYSPGTLYNIFENLDDVLLTLQINTLADVYEKMAGTPGGGTPEATLDALADTYLEFALENRHLWNLLFAHQLPDGVAAPAALHNHVNNGMKIIQSALAPMMPTSSDSETDAAARTLWVGVHGITAIAVTQKGPTITPNTARDHVRRLTSTYVAGLKAIAARQCAKSDGIGVAAQSRALGD